MGTYRCSGKFKSAYHMTYAQHGQSVGILSTSTASGALIQLSLSEDLKQPIYS